MAKEDPVREFLREKGRAPQTIEGGLAGLVEAWEKVVRSVEAGYSLGLDDYLNDLDVRQLMEEALAAATGEQRNEFSPRIARADDAMRSLVEALDRCLWGEEVAEEEGWTAQNNWWYYARPIQAGPDLLAEIDESFEE